MNPDTNNAELQKTLKSKELLQIKIGAHWHQFLSLENVIDEGLNGNCFCAQK